MSPEETRDLEELIKLLFYLESSDARKFIIDKFYCAELISRYVLDVTDYKHKLKLHLPLF